MRDTSIDQSREWLGLASMKWSATLTFPWLRCPSAQNAAIPSIEAGILWPRFMPEECLARLKITEILFQRSREEGISSFNDLFF